MLFRNIYIYIYMYTYICIYMYYVSRAYIHVTLQTRFEISRYRVLRARGFKSRHEFEVSRGPCKSLVSSRCVHVTRTREGEV